MAERATGAAVLVLAAVILAACAGTAADRTSTSPSGPPAPSTAHEAGRAGHEPHDAIRPAVASSGASSANAPSATATRCPGTRADQVVVVSLAVQHAWLCHRGATVRSYPITSGRATPRTRTPTGDYRIQGRNRNSVLTLSSGRQYDVKYWIPFDAPDFGFHDAPWQRIPFGSQRYRTQGSHGCIHMPGAAVAFLYRWVEIGAKVRITAG